MENGIPLSVVQETMNQEAALEAYDTLYAKSNTTALLSGRVMANDGEYLYTSSIGNAEDAGFDIAY